MRSAAKNAVTNIPGDVADILVYQSGKYSLTTTTLKIIGMLNSSAIGNPFSNLAAMLLSFSLFCSQ